MISASNLLSLAVLYICILFLVAWAADRRGDQLSGRNGARIRGLIYALSLAVYCSSWTFYGAVGSAAQSPWSHAPIYLGPILVFIFCWPLIKRLLQVGARHRVTSIADYIGARFGKRQALAVLVTVVATTAVLPYIALQFKALAQAWTIIAGSNVEVEAIGGDTALLMAIILAVFTILFGTRRLDGRERHQGVMAAIAVESLVKLGTFVLVAMLAIAFLWQIEPGALVPTEQDFGSRLGLTGEGFTLTPDFIARTLISGLAILCLPRQFHVMVVEAQEETDTRIARWMFPAYLMIFMVLAVPISSAGALLYATSPDVNPDIYVQMLPVSLNSSWITVAAFIGGISAATGMAIVATVSLAIMITNEVVAPLLMRLQSDSPAAVLKLGDHLRRVRQVTIAAIMVAAWLVTRLVMDIPWLTQIGFICFLAAAQLAPAIIAGLYWRRAHGLGVIFGLLAGLGLWLYSAVLPMILAPEHALVDLGPFGVEWLRPLHLMGIHAESKLAYATAWTLGANISVLVALSLLLKPSSTDTRQARIFTAHSGQLELEQSHDFSLSLIRISQLQALLPPFLEPDELKRMWSESESTYEQRLLPADRAPQFVVQRVESALASIIGATSAHKILEQLEQSQQLAYSDLAGMVSGASKHNTFNRELLQTTVESLLQGVAVVDQNLQLVAWNKRYEDMFDYPERLLYIGCPIERIYRFNAQRGILGTGERSIEDEIETRINWLRQGNPHRLERILPDGSVIDIRGNPMPQGGFVTTYIDITDYREVLAQLEETKQELEAQVAEGSESLSETNAMLRQENRLRAQVEARLRDANLSKSRFMSATSHDLLQPINAARLFTSVLKPKIDADDSETHTIVDQIEDSLTRAEQLIAELREIARLDSGRQQPRPEHFPISRLFDQLKSEFEPEAERRGLKLAVHSHDIWLYTDPNLLYRILQNLLGNAVKYTQQGEILLGVRRRQQVAEIQILDTGPGIAQADQVKIFEEFERLHQATGSDDTGLGLGLAIVKRYIDLLELKLELHSKPSKGSRFGVQVPWGQAQAEVVQGVDEPVVQDLGNMTIWCLDNEQMILDGMDALLSSLGAQVYGFTDGDTMLQARKAGGLPDIILADYHLDDLKTGMDALQVMEASGYELPPCIIISANDSNTVRDEALTAGYRVMPKPINANRLKALIIALVSSEKR